MKRVLIVLSILAVTAVAAQAQTKGKAAQNPNASLPPCCQTDGAAAPGKVTNEQVQKFLDSTAALRQDLAGKNAEYQALLAQANPDPKQAGEVAKQIFELRGKIAAEAAKQGLNQYAMMGPGAGGCPMGGGYGRGAGGCVMGRGGRAN
jgi:hypothetical protein